MSKKIINTNRVLYCFISGLVFCLISWVYLNSFYTFSVEDSFFQKTAFVKFKLGNTDLPEANKMIFINTGKDVVLVNDTAWGQIAISDRLQVAKLLKYINRKDIHPQYTVLDLQFFLPNSFDLSTDSLLQAVIKENKNLSIPILLDENNRCKYPLYKGDYSISDYVTYGSNITKFRLNYANLGYVSTPLKIYMNVNKGKWNDHTLFWTEKSHLAMNYIWPFYYLDEKRVKEKTYNIGELLYQFEFDTTSIKKYLDGKLIFIGNFDQDQHATPVGKMPGTLVLANLYLNLVVGQHIISYYWIGFMFLCFSILSFFTWYFELPAIRFRYRFIFSHHFSAYLKGFASFFGIMFLISILSVSIFGLYVNIFLPTALLSAIYYFVHKKYQPDEQT
ncbi:MAG: CHASE2 domain-containing protein [Bacteroidota bacterium]